MLLHPFNVVLFRCLTSSIGCFTEAQLSTVLTATRSCSGSCARTNRSDCRHCEGLDSDLDEGLNVASRQGVACAAHSLACS